VAKNDPAGIICWITSPLVSMLSAILLQRLYRCFFCFFDLAILSYLYYSSHIGYTWWLFVGKQNITILGAATRNLN